MDAGWIEALADLWRSDSPIDFAALEKTWQLRPLEISGVPAPTQDNPEPTRERLLVCLTGFMDREFCLSSFLSVLPFFFADEKIFFF